MDTPQTIEALCNYAAKLTLNGIESDRYIIMTSNEFVQLLGDPKAPQYLDAVRYVRDYVMTASWRSCWVEPLGLTIYITPPHEMSVNV